MLTAWLVGGLSGARAETVGSYDLGYNQIARLNSELCASLTPARRKAVGSETVLLEHVRLPFLATRTAASAGAARTQISVGSVEFLNRLAHAKAHGESEPGFFTLYAIRIADDAKLSPLSDFDVLLPRKAWNFQTLNRQASYYNQMAGGLLAIELAHQYLGHYRKHAAALVESAAVPPSLNNLLSEAEWHEAVLVGAKNALACGISTDGLRALFESFDSMPQRPAWAAYFIHPHANVRRLNEELAKEERDFFAMEKQPKKSAKK